MEKIDFFKRLEKKEVKAEDIADNVMKDLTLLPSIFNELSSKKSRARFKSAKILRIISERNPKALYSKMDFFTDLLDSENRIFKWIAIDVIGNLTSVDFRNKFEEIHSKYFNFLSTEEMITVGHVIDNSRKIAKAKPILTQKITSQLLKLEHLTTTPKLTSECKNILLGKTILAFSQYFTQIKNKREVISFVKKQLSNPRNATKKKAERFLKKWNTLQMKNIEE